MALDPFATPIDRRGSASTKWNRYAGRDVLPFWVADMEFRAPEPVIAALHERVDHGIFGYTDTPVGLTEATLAFLDARYAWKVEPEWLVWLPGVVPGFNLACRAVGERGDAVMTAVPVYYPFLDAPANAERRRIDTRLVLDGGRWAMDFEALEAALTPDTRLFMLCNPQNPTGRIYERAELERLAEIAARHELVLCSDEIHAELLLDETRLHLPIATLDADTARRTITLMAPTKTFNTPGLSCAFAVIPDATLRRRFRASGAGLVPGVGPLAYTAAEAAYRHGEPWRQALLQALRRNRDRLQGTVDALPGLSMTRVEATCLAWIDARGLGLEDPHGYFESQGLGLSPGRQFGEDGFVPFNFACHEAMLEEGLARLRRAVEGRVDAASHRRSG
ncbi:MAG: PatB family C-S lyase [Pseudomonadales bacterium]|jgi:cystathionine beta-lyase|nr:PatB family C-S lyase [Pseudomonadales bacterium]